MLQTPLDTNRSVVKAPGPSAAQLLPVCRPGLLTRSQLRCEEPPYRPQQAEIDNAEPVRVALGSDARDGLGRRGRPGQRPRSPRSPGGRTRRGRRGGRRAPSAPVAAPPPAGERALRLSLGGHRQATSAGHGVHRDDAGSPGPAGRSRRAFRPNEAVWVTSTNEQSTSLRAGREADISVGRGPSHPGCAALHSAGTRAAPSPPVGAGCVHRRAHRAGLPAQPRGPRRRLPLYREHGG